MILVETIVARPRKNNTAAYMAKIVRKSEGKVVYRETATFDIGYIKTIPAHAAAVHGVVPSTEGIGLARVALCSRRIRS